MTKIKEQRLYHLKSFSKHDDLDKHMNSVLSKKYGERFGQYRNDWYQSEKREYVPDFPLLVGIETVDFCNYSCSHCYRFDSHGSKDRIDLQVFNRIVEECKQNGLPCLVFGGGSEPMLHPNIMEMIKHSLDNEIMDVFLGTNGTKLTKENIDQMIEWGLPRLEVSLDANTPETYKKLRGGDLEKIEEMIRYAYERRETLGKKLPIIRLSFVVTDENYSEAPDFIEKWKYIADKIDLQDCIDFKNVDDLKEIPIEKMYCPMPWNRVNIWANGDISPCCTFYGKHLIFGNIHKNTIKEVWDSIQVKNLRESLVTGNYYKVCKNCYGNLNKI